MLRLLRQLVGWVLSLRGGWLIAIAAAYLYVFPYFPRIHSANELPRVFLVRAIVDDHTFAIDHQMQLAHETNLADVSPSGGHIYSNKAPGSSLLAVPFYAAVRWTAGDPGPAWTMWLCRIFAGAIPALLFLWLLWGFLARFAPEPELRRLVLVAYALGSMAMTYALLYYSHQLSAVCIASAWILACDVLDRKRGMRAMIAIGLLAGAAPLVDYQAGFAGVPLAVYFVVRAWGWPKRELVRALAIAAAAAVVPIAILLAYHAACFGSPWRTGYNASQTFAMYHQQGFLGMTRPHGEALVATLLSPDDGLLTLAPWLALAVPGGIALWHRGERAMVLVCTAVAVLFVLFESSLTFWRGGWSVGPRYVTVMLPFLLPLVAAALVALRARPLALGAVSGTIVAGVVIYTASFATFPYWPDSLADPLYEVTFRLLGDGAVAPNLGTTWGLSGLASLVPYVALVAGTTGWAIVRAAGWRGLGAAIVVGAVLVGMLGVAPHGGREAERAYVQTIHPAVMQAW